MPQKQNAAHKKKKITLLTNLNAADNLFPNIG